MTNKIDILISVCSAKDIDTWKFSAPEVVKRIPASQYVIYVPDEEVKKFRSVAPDDFIVVAESTIVHGIKQRLLDVMQNKERVGWYLQQFIKLAALRQNSDNERLLLWDADTVPFRDLEFFQVEGLVQFFYGVEHHTPYFSQIKRVFKFERWSDKSFIAQCLPAKGAWLSRFFCDLDRLAGPGKDWRDVLIDSIDFSQDSGLSEYELLGNYFLNNFESELGWADGTWLRFGFQRFGSVRFPKTRSEMSFAYVSFECWDNRRRPLLDTIRNLRISAERIFMSNRD